MVDEIKVQFPEIENLLVQLAGAPEIVTHAYIGECMRRAQIADERLENAIDLLWDATFLGLEKQSNLFEFLYRPSDKPIVKSLAERTAESTGQRRYKINIPFHRFLEIVPSNSTDIV
jgi:hypothetical protein